MHIAGTNGKGSTAATLEALLAAPGRRVGKFTSPHLVDFRERIVVGGEPIAPDAVVAFVEGHRDAIERTGATFFEASTALAFHHFAADRVDVAVIETGLGGRLDSTNVVQPLVAVVTTIGIDHVEYLGNTVTEIAREKAGIFKPGAPAVIGEPDAAISAQLAAHAAAAGASRVLTLRDRGLPRDVVIGADGTSFTLDWHGAPRRLRTPLIGRHQALNTATALLALEALGAPYDLAEADAASALAAVRVPGRFDRRPPYLFDVAHNPDGAAVLATTIAAVQVERPIATVLAVLADKDWRGMMAALAPVTDRFVLTTAPTAPAGRLWDPGAALAFAEAQGWAAQLVPDFDAALAAGREIGRTVLVTGSFHTVGDALARLQGAPSAG